MSAFSIGQRVTVTRPIYEQGDDLPPSRLASPGEVLEVRKLGSDAIVPEGWACYIGHPEREPAAMFGVKANEIKPL